MNSVVVGTMCIAVDCDKPAALLLEELVLRGGKPILARNAFVSFIDSTSSSSFVVFVAAVVLLST